MSVSDCPMAVHQERVATGSPERIALQNGRNFDIEQRDLDTPLN